MRAKFSVPEIRARNAELYGGWRTFLVVLILWVKSFKMGVSNSRDLTRTLFRLGTHFMEFPQNGFPL